MVIEEAPPYDEQTNNCRHFSDRLEEALRTKVDANNVYRLVVATKVSEVLNAIGGMKGVHAMVGLTIAKGIPGEHDVYIEPQTGEVFYGSELNAYLTERMNIPNPVTIAFHKSFK